MTAPDVSRARGPLGLLCDDIVRQREDSPFHAAYPELPLLDELRELWASLGADQQLRQSEEQVPDNAGPLNSSHLIHRSLSLMRAQSPDYLRQFLAYAETLSWMEELVESSVAPRNPAMAGARKSTRGAKAR
ncbi:hypothetical protein BER2_3441 [plant metagenome]|uniref:DUF2894 domain-containing protein n=1 Tax=plant metagenome TaxID=1297885 RepID=A0A484RCR3_9ZZZZ